MKSSPIDDDSFEFCWSFIHGCAGQFDPSAVDALKTLHNRLLDLMLGRRLDVKKAVCGLCGVSSDRYHRYRFPLLSLST
jgi:hypothetical protein